MQSDPKEPNRIAAGVIELISDVNGLLLTKQISVIVTTPRASTTFLDDRRRIRLNDPMTHGP
jgi:hypothetical protein